MRLTEQGRVLLDYAQRAFDLLDEAEAQVSAGQAALVGTIRIAAPSDLARNVLLPWFDEFMTLHPGVQLQLHVGDRPKDVVRDDVDIALRYGARADSQLVARTLATPCTVLCAAPAYLARHGTPATPHDWARAGHGILLKIRIELQRDLDSVALVPLLAAWETDVYPLHALMPNGRFVPARLDRRPPRAVAQVRPGRAPGNDINPDK